jgi:hypothetical protein
MENIDSKQFLEPQVNFDENSEGLVIEKVQAIPQNFIDSLRAEKGNSKAVRENEYMRVASIPVIVVEKWLNEGFDFWNASAKEIVTRLKQENLDYFVTTEKQV